MIYNQKNKRNSTHGQQLTQDEKKVYALKWWGVLPDDDIKTALSISRASFDKLIDKEKTLLPTLAKPLLTKNENSTIKDKIDRRRKSITS